MYRRASVPNRRPDNGRVQRFDMLGFFVHEARNAASLPAKSGLHDFKVSDAYLPGKLSLLKE